MGEPILRLEALDKSFGALHVTRAVSLDIRPGEVHAIIGPNGAGKTTLINQITGQLTPDAGHVRFKGHDVTGQSVHERARLGLARTFQITSVMPAMTARDNVVLAIVSQSRQGFRLWPDAQLRAQGRAAADEALATVGLGRRAGVIAADLAHGERRALELAMALAQQPALLLLDEPMAGTGKGETERLTELLRGFKRRIPMLLVEHDMGAVFALADRVSVLVEGAIIATGSPAEVAASSAVKTAYLGEDITP
ncbi:MAG: ABC transporter ATP-binding protein [Hyphomicrobiaceae bacterium]|nr:ABC transporter ATP-binding protein [Hyphomicrobiaceae bacterium]